ncbi:MAG: formate--tetrahydrofolate ligase, partial [Sneathiellales bacterium]|nr:formate--tetrahydrofolate ligase [Sneathiellales bacterium]
MSSQHTDPKSDIDIANAARMKPILEIARERLGVDAENLEPFGHFKAKISLDYIRELESRPDGKLILVTAMTPTPAGEGKTTTTVGLGDALNKIGKNTMICLREPSLGPCFGMKGGAAGGGYAQVVPMADINLHFTGDFHAIGVANNLLAAMIDNHIYWGNKSELDERRISWRRVVDMNDRALRNIVGSLGGISDGFPREDHFDITVASEVMAIFCLATDLNDLKNRLGNIVVGYTRAREPVYARDLEAHGAMTALLKDAFQPNLVQTLENNPAFIHGGPFGNIAHGCNSVLATKTALKLADYVVTEAGFGADLGAEKFLDIKCRKSGLSPEIAVVVATIRALKMHGGVEKEDLNLENVEAVQKGSRNLSRHIDNLRKFGLPVIVALNKFSADTNAEMAALEEICHAHDVKMIVSDHWGNGGEGAVPLAEAVVAEMENTTSELQLIYEDQDSLWDKTRAIAQKIYAADDIIADKKVRNQFKDLQDQGFGHYPICIAKTQYSFSTDPNLKGAPSNHVVPIREIRVAGGAEFV